MQKLKCLCVCVCSVLLCACACVLLCACVRSGGRRGTYYGGRRWSRDEELLRWSGGGAETRSGRHRESEGKREKGKGGFSLGFCLLRF